MSLPDLSIPGIELMDEIDRGVHGIVYLGNDAVRGKVAVKTITRLNTETAAAWTQRKADLLNEGQRLTAAEHPHVVRVFQLREAPHTESVVLVMELCDKGSLKVPYEAGPMSIATLRPFLFDAALGLEALHARDMLHRDIKPANILLGVDGRARLGDFGLVTDALDSGYAAMAGYENHFAPEVHAERLTSVRSDIWAFGMTVYRLLHGHDFYSIQLRPASIIPLGGFSDTLRWLPHVPIEWKRFVRKALHDDPYRRFQNAASLIEAISRLPVGPNWTCVYSAEEVRWEVSRKNRKLVTVWWRDSPRKHKWVAESHPIGTGRIRRLGGSDGYVGVECARTELSDFFKSAL